MEQHKKVAIITGSGRGIGRGTAAELAKSGWTIVINDVGNPEPPQETLALVRAAGSDGLVILADITAPRTASASSSRPCRRMGGSISW